MYEGRGLLYKRPGLDRGVGTNPPNSITKGFLNANPNIMDKATFNNLAKEALAKLEPFHTMFVGVRRNPTVRNSVSVRLQTCYPSRNSDDLGSDFLRESWKSSPGKIPPSGNMPAYFQSGTPEDLSRLFPFAKDAIDKVMSDDNGDYAFVGKVDPLYKDAPIHVTSVDMLVPTKNQAIDVKRSAKKNPTTGEYSTHSGALIFARTSISRKPNYSVLENTKSVANVDDAYCFKPGSTAEDVALYQSNFAVVMSEQEMDENIA